MRFPQPQAQETDKQQVQIVNPIALQIKILEQLIKLNIQMEDFRKENAEKNRKRK